MTEDSGRGLRTFWSLEGFGSSRVMLLWLNTKEVLGQIGESCHRKVLISFWCLHCKQCAEMLAGTKRVTKVI